MLSKFINCKIAKNCSNLYNFALSLLFLAIILPQFYRIIPKNQYNKQEKI